MGEEWREMKVRIVGDSPLITNAWSEKAKQMLWGGHTGCGRGREGTTGRRQKEGK